MLENTNKKNAESIPRAFTLIELLVVIAVIALLIAILVPLLSRAKELTRRTVCKSYMHQFILASTVYANNNNDKLPSFTASAGPHVHNFTLEFVEYYESYGFAKEKFYCPSIPQWRVERSLNNPLYQDYFISSYDYWVPRIADNTGLKFPPRQSNGYYSVYDNSDYLGPRKLSDKNARVNPIITDNVQLPDSFLPPNKIKEFKAPNINQTLQSHYWRGKIEMTNQGFTDGHVEKVNADDMTPRYSYGNGYIWR